MSEIIKFRAWDGFNKKMSFWTMNDLCTWDTKDEKPSPFDDWMQSTGVKDKNGRVIYRGDIVRMLYTDWPSQTPDKEGKFLLSSDEYRKSISEKGVVVYEYDRFCLEFIGRYRKYTDRMKPGDHGECEIIGNIHENPELLK